MFEDEIIEAHTNDDDTLIGRWFVPSKSKPGYYVRVSYIFGYGLECSGEWCYPVLLGFESNPKPCRHMRLAIEKAGVECSTN